MGSPIVRLLLILAVSLLAQAAGQKTAAAAAGSGPSAVERALDRADYAAALRVAKSLPPSANTHVLAARAYMGQNDGAKALRELRAALRQNPKSLDALYYVSKLAGVLSQQQFLELAQIAPDSGRIHQLRGEAYEAQGNGADAEREYLAALERQPGTTSILIALGDVHRLQKHYEEALKWYGQVLERDPSNYEAVYGTGVCYRYAKSPEDALPYFQKALKIDPASMAAKMALGESLVLTGKPAEALPYLETAAKANPNLRRLQFLLGRAYRETGREEDARRAFARVKELTKPGGDSDPLASEEQ